MRAVVFEQWENPPVLADIDRPIPGPGEVLLKIAGAGACHSDVAVFHDYDASTGLPQLSPSYVLGHENAGWIEELGPGVTGLTPATPSWSTVPSAAGFAQPAPEVRTRTAPTSRICRISPLASDVMAGWPST